MMATKFIYLFVICFLGCLSPDGDGGGTDPGGGTNIESTRFVPSSFNRNYVFLESDSKIKDRNFYWTTLIEKNSMIAGLLEKDVDLSTYLETAKQRLSNIVNQSNVTAVQYANALKFSDNERVAISTSVKKAVENNATEFINFSSSHIGPSGAFNHFQEVTNVARLNQLIVEEMLLGINQIIDTYAAGIDPRYPDIDRVSFDVNSGNYKLLLKNLVNQLHSNQYSLFYQPVLDFALGVMEINSRDEAGRFVPLREGENAQVYQNIQTIKWEDFQYSVLVVLGDAPNSSGDLPNISIGGMERCDYAVGLFNQGNVPLIAFTGSNVAPFQSQYHEAIEMKKYVMDKYGIPESKILVDPHARHTTTNMRNIGRLIYRYGIPVDKKALLSTIKTQSEYVASNQFATRCTNEIGAVPMELYNRTSDRDIEFSPIINVLHLDSSDPLDP